MLKSSYLKGGIYIALLLNSISVYSFDQRFLDLMIAHHEEAVNISSLIQEKGTSLELKREARRMMRDNRRELQIMKQWRENYFSDEITHSWVVLTDYSEKLGNFSGRRFDQESLLALIHHHQNALKLLERSQKLSKKAFIKTFGKQELKDKREDLKKLLALQEKLNYSW
jgi:uncharacterized protein (DUF305 family)